MKRSRSLSPAVAAGLVVAMVLPAVVHAAAGNAPRWRVSGVFLAAGAAKGAHASADTAIQIKAGALSLESPIGTCWTLESHIFGSAVQAPGTADGKLKCTAVTVVGSEKVCTVKSVGAEANREIVTAPLTKTLVWRGKTGQTAGLLVEPAAGAVVVEIDITGKGCPVAKETPYALTGSMLGWVSPVAQEVKTGELAFPSPAELHYFNNEVPRVEQTINGLKVGANAAAISGTFSISLDPSQFVGVFEG